MTKSNPLTPEDMELVTGDGFQYSAVQIDELGTTTVTIATICTDCSPSVEDYKDAIEAMMKECIGALQKDDNADNMAVRHLTFAAQVSENHGFRPLMQIAPASYDGSIKIAGGTAVYKATHDAVKATLDWADTLRKGGCRCNAIIIVLTDGEDNSSGAITAKKVGQTVKNAVQSELLDSCAIILIGFGLERDSTVQALDKFKQEAGINAFVSAKDANAKTIAKIGGIISDAISSTSQALGSGGPSQKLPSGNLSI